VNDLLEALQIFQKYVADAQYAPTHCEHDELWIMDVGETDPSKEEIERLDELGFFWSEDTEGWMSFRFGSA